MSTISYHTNYDKKFFCPQEQVAMFDFIRENNSQLFDSIIKAVAVKKSNNQERDVMVTIFFSRDDKCPKTCTPEQFKLIKKFQTPHTATCPSIHSGGWITDNVFVIGQ